MELIIAGVGMYYLHRTLGKTERNVEYMRNADEPMCPKCYYNVQRQNLPDAGNSQAFESAYFEPKSVPEIRKEITKSIFYGNRMNIANSAFNSGIVSRQLQIKGDQKTQIGRIPITYSGWLAESIAQSYVPKVISLWPEQSVPKV